jgi:hypothetical protein
MTVDIPAGALTQLDGLLIINVPTLIADPSIDDPIAIGGPVMMTLINNSYDDCYHEHFDNGNRAWICMDYDEADIPEGYAEEDLRIAWWSQDNQEWYFDEHSEFALPTVDTETNKACVYVDQTGTYSVTATKPLRISTPVFDPRCACVEDVCYTGVWPTFCTIVEDMRYSYVDEILVVLNGPAGNPIYDDTIIYDAGGGESGGSGWFSEVEYGAGWYGTYEETSNRLCLKLVHSDNWSSYWDYWDEDWFFFYGDIISDGLPAGTYTVDITAQNEMGDTENLTYTFKVDATPPDVDFVGEYVMKDPEFTLTVTDLESGVETGSIFLDIFGVEPDDDYCCDYDTEHEDYLGTATPTAMDFDPVSGGYTVTFADMAYGGTLADGMSIDVVVYNGSYHTGGDCSYGECRKYDSDDGVLDCAENAANPLWRRFTVDAMPPSMEIVSDEGASEIEIVICDTGAGIDPDEFLIDGEEIGETDYEWSWLPTSPTCGKLTIDIGEGAVDIDVTATDGAGNFQVLEITTSADVVDLFDIKSYPNPFDPSAGENANIVYTLSKPAHVTISIYDFAGAHVKTVVDMYRGSGTYTDMWMGVNGGGDPVASGAYIAYIRVEDSYKTVTRNLKIGVVKGGN